jgi:hypothetical protein
MGCKRTTRDSFHGDIMQFAALIRREQINKFPHCPDCKQAMDIMDLNDKPCRMVPGYGSMVFCRMEDHCGYSSLLEKTVDEFLERIGFNQYMVVAWKAVKGFLEFKKKDLGKRPCCDDSERNRGRNIRIGG